MNNNEIVAIALDIVSHHTLYGWGCFGQKATPTFVSGKAKQYPNWYTPEKVERLSKSNAELFDCVGLIKSICWGYPNVRYNSNGCPDVTANKMISLCESSTDFNGIVLGSVVWMDGHIGLYVGNGFVVESTNNSKFGDGVVRTRLQDRKWLKWGKLPFVDYGETTSNPDRLNQFIEELNNLINKYK